MSNILEYAVEVEYKMRRYFIINPNSNNSDWI